jgi:hypothetical protein
MLRRAVAALKSDKTGAIAKFNRNEPPFRDRDLFVFYDAKGKPVGAEMYSNAQEGRISDVTYTAPVPGSIRLTTKTAYVTRIGDQVCGVSAYRFVNDSSPTR